MALGRSVSCRTREIVALAVVLPAPCLGLAQGSAATQPIAAASAPSDSVAEVVVTAERVDTLERKTPISVGVIDKNEIERRGLYELRDLVGVVAGVTVPNGDSNMPQAVGIRGVGVSIAAMSQAVPVYVDDVPLIRGYSTSTWDLPDIERIEILRGPQGTLYGQNSTAGAVKLISLDPGPVASAWISASAGNYGAFESHAYADAPIGQSPLSASLAFARRRNDGFGYNATTGDRIEKLDTTQFRAKLRWSDGPRTNVVMAVDGLLDRSDVNNVNFPLNAPVSIPRVSYTSADVGDFKGKYGGSSLKIEQQITPDLQLRAITGYRAYDANPTVTDYGGLVVQRYGLDQTSSQNAFSEELQLNGNRGGLRWTAGLMLVQDRFHFDRYTVSYALAAPGPSYNEAKTWMKTTDMGIYGQGRYSLSESTGLTLGMRGYHTKQDAENDFWVTDVNKNRTAVVYTAPNLETQKAGWLPRIGIDHQWNLDLYSYASIARGEKFGGFNRAAQSLISARYATSPEQVTTYEIGNKGRFLGGQVSASAVAFYNDYRDYLASLNNSTVNGVLVTDSVLVNAGKAQTYGIDFDIAAKILKQTDVTASLEWLRSRFIDFLNPTGTAGGNYVGNQLPFAPKISAGASIVQSVNFENGSLAKMDASVSYIQAQYTDVANTESLKTGSQTYFNLGSTYYLPGQHWSFAVRVRNLFNRTNIALHVSIPPLGVNSANYAPPRTVLFTARYDM